MDRIVGSRKWVVQTGNLLSASCLLALWAFPMSGELTAILLLAAIGFFGASFPVIMAHGRSFFPPHMVGRGVSLLNLFGIGGTGLFQLLSGRVHASAVAGGATPVEAYGLLFLFFALIALAGSAIYLFSQDRTD
jgi:nitrate/nitrite transporter NarK